MKNIIYFLFCFTFLQACTTDSIDNYVKFEKESLPTATGENLIGGYVITSSFESFQPVSNLQINKDTSLNLNPFKDYLNRTFFKGVASKYFLEEVPGHLFKKENNGSITKVTINRLIEKGAYPKIEAVDEIYFNSKITDRKSLNVAASIINIGISKNEVVELILKDEVASYLPDTLFNENIIVNLSKKLEEEDWEDYYLAKGAVISSVVSKIYKESKFEKKVNAGWITSEGEIYNSNENFKQRKDISLELVSLKDYLKFIELNNATDN